MARRGRTVRSQFLSKLAGRRARDLIDAVEAGKYWRSLISSDALFAVALTRARTKTGKSRMARATGVGRVIVPEEVHSHVRRYRILHLERYGSGFRVTHVLTWPAFRRLIRLGEEGKNIWGLLPDFVDREAIVSAIKSSRGGP